MKVSVTESVKKKLESEIRYFEARKRNDEEEVARLREVVDNNSERHHVLSEDYEASEVLVDTLRKLVK